MTPDSSSPTRRSRAPMSRAAGVLIVSSPVCPLLVKAPPPAPGSAGAVLLHAQQGGREVGEPSPPGRRIHPG
jgi:hypothetical protein